MNRFLAALVHGYQRTLSPDHGWFRRRHPYGFCRFTPTCSEYTRQALLTHGTVRGLWLGMRRLLRCHPWSAGGADPVPKEIR
ncbi:MAG: membrane protein insertion efficiency factor YidD [Candidatus Kerfeldbacteria bacterium]|nr:membrane protein insertion efficiency factor YidD [Candidatus Kerfeldbacteria bacterium]